MSVVKAVLLVVLSLFLGLMFAPASLASAPSPSYTAFTAFEQPSRDATRGGSTVLVGTDQVYQSVLVGTRDLYFITTAAAPRFLALELTPATGSDFSVGRYTSGDVGDRHLIASISVNGVGGLAQGSVVIKEVSYGGSANVSTFAADYDLTTPSGRVTGSVRWYSSKSYQAFVTPNRGAALGPVAPGGTADAVFDVVNIGVAGPATFAPARLSTQVNNPTFTIITDSCSTAPVLYAQSCRVVVRATPTTNKTKRVVLSIPQRGGGSSLAFAVAVN